METKFQTSFIPKKSLTPASPTVSANRESTSILLLIGVLVFVVSILAAAGSYGWQKYLESKQNGYGANLATLEKNFNTNSIVALKTTATKIDLASALLKNHIALSQVFGALSAITAENIRFTALDLEVTTGKQMQISMKLPWWPLHPLAFAVTSSWEINLVWGPLFLAWLFKSLILRYGGRGGFHKALPFFIGLMLGQFVVGSLWNIYGISVGLPTYQFWQ